MDDTAVHIFWDNSNLFAGASRMSGVQRR